MTDHEEFEHLVRDALTNLYHPAALEIHPLASLLPWPQDGEESRAEFLHRALLEAVEALRPTHIERSTSSVEWRPYLILHGRYVEGASLQELESRLALSGRQLRREHGRALRAVATVLWDQSYLPQAQSQAEEGATLEPWESSVRTFEISHEPLDVVKVVHGVVSILERRVESQGAALSIELSPELPQVQADRVILRQILLSLINHALHVRSDGEIGIGAEVRDDRLALWIRYHVQDPSISGAELEASADTVSYWVQRLGAVLERAVLPGEQTEVRLVLLLPRVRESLVLVVDDQEAAIHMFRRYLSQTGLRVVGVKESDRVLALASQLQPLAITLDVMMPTVDGWEILQALQADPETCDIPVIVCSVWDEPELAYSLGAAAFLKKPITQKDLWDALAQLGLLDRLDGLSAAGIAEQASARSETGDGAS
jgi:CheY-like chemotaxis protein